MGVALRTAFPGRGGSLSAGWSIRIEDPRTVHGDGLASLPFRLTLGTEAMAGWNGWSFALPVAVLLAFSVIVAVVWVLLWATRLMVERVRHRIQGLTQPRRVEHLIFRLPTRIKIG